MRALFVEGALRDNGGLRVTCDLADRWAAEGVSARLLVLERPVGEGPVYTPPADLDVRFASDKVRRTRNALPFMTLGMLRETAAADVVISGSEVGFGLLLGWFAARLLRRPFVVLVQSDLGKAIDAWSPARLRGALRQVHRRVDLAACVSPGLRPSVLENGLPESRITTIPVGIDVQKVIDRGRPEPTGDAVLASPVLAGTRLAPGPDGGPAVPLVVAAGRLSSQKGFDILLRAHARARSNGADHRLLIIGAGDERSRLEAIIAEENLCDTVLLAGYLPEPQPFIARADLFVLSSRYEGNGGLVLMEAMAQGLPVIATDCPSGPRYLLQNGALGDLVPTEDPEALAEAILAFVKDPDPLRQAAQGGPGRVRSFESSVAASELRLQVEELLGCRAADDAVVTAP